MFAEIYLFNLKIPTYYLMMGLGLTAMMVLMLRRRGLYALSAPQATGFALLLMVCGVLGCKLLYIVENWEKIQNNGLSLGGFSFFGAVFLIPLLMPLIGLLFRLRPSQTLDACAPCVVAMLALVRVGCFLNGCCGGWETMLGNFCFHWPTQAVESIGDFCILMLLLNVEEQHACPGRLYSLFLVGYGVLRFFVEFFRDTPKEWLGFSHGQWFSMIGCLIGTVVLLREMRTERGQN